MGMSFLMLTGHELIGLTVSEKEKADQMTAYLTTELKRRAIPGKVTVYTEQEKFFAALKKTEKATGPEEVMWEQYEFLRSLAI